MKKVKLYPLKEDSNYSEKERINLDSDWVDYMHLELRKAKGRNDKPMVDLIERKMRGQLTEHTYYEKAVALNLFRVQSELVMALNKFDDPPLKIVCGALHSTMRMCFSACDNAKEYTDIWAFIDTIESTAIYYDPLPGQ